MGEDLTRRDVLVPPLILCGVMLIVGLVTGTMAGIDGTGLFRAYIFAALGIVPMTLLVWAFIEFAAMARRLEDRPIPKVLAKMPKRLEFVVLPILVFPLFLVGFTTAKTAIPILVGFRWDALWADLDRALLGVDGWRLTHSYSSPFVTHWWAWCYTFLWGTVLAASKAWVAMCGTRREIGTFYTAMLLCWLLGGWLMAYATSAAGPVFAHLYDHSLAVRFAPLQASLDQLLEPGNAVRRTQGLLAAAAGNDRIAVRGGGISAMPSMHVGAATIYVCATWGGRLLPAAVVFWVVTLIGSVHFGYHYLVDGIVAAGIALLCWSAARAYFLRPAQVLGRIRTAYVQLLQLPGR